MSKRILNMKDLKQYIQKLEETMMTVDKDFDLSSIPVFAKITSGYASMIAPIEICEIHPEGEMKRCMFRGGDVQIVGKEGENVEKKEDGK